MKKEVLFKYLFVILGSLYPACLFASSYRANGVSYTIIDESRVKVGRDPWYNSSHQAIYESAIDNNTEGTVIIPSTITILGKTYIVTEIGNEAFRKCSRITSIELPETLTAIKDSAFQNCSSLTNIRIPEHVTSIGIGVFKGCSALTNVTILCESIRNSLFLNSTSIQKVHLGPSVRFIRSSAFAGCKNLNSINFASSITEIGSRSFEGCTQLKKIDIPNSVTTIGYQAFQNCTSLESVIIGENVESFGNSVFAGCTNLRYVYSNIQSPQNISSIFQNVSSESVLYVPRNQKESYEMCSGWNVFNEIKEIGTPLWSCWETDNGTVNAEFMILDPLRFEVQLGIGDKEAFDDFGLQSLDIPSCITDNNGVLYKVTAIGEHAFSKNDELLTLYIPQEINCINETFVNCTNLCHVKIDNRSPNTIDINVNSFNNLSTDATLYVPAGTAERYAEHPVWGKFTNIIEASPISVGDVSARYGSQVELPIYLKNNEQIAGLQFKLTLPDGVTAKEEDGYVVTSTTDRTNGFTILGRKDPDEENSYLFIALSLSGDNIDGNEGAFMNVLLDVADTLSLGDHSISIDDIVLTTNLFIEQKPEGSYADLTVTDIALGDVNGDGNINVTDVGMVIDHILERTPTNFILSAADVNGDNQVNVTDVGLIIGIILSDGSASRKFDEKEAVDMLDPQ